MTFGVLMSSESALSGLKAPLSENEVLLYDAPWVLERMGHPDRIRILRELMVGDAMDDDIDPFPSMTDEELLEAADAMGNATARKHRRNATTQKHGL